MEYVIYGETWTLLFKYKFVIFIINELEYYFSERGVTSAKSVNKSYSDGCNDKPHLTFPL